MVYPLRVAWRLNHWGYYEIPGYVKIRVPPQLSWEIPVFSSDLSKCAENI